MLFWKEVLTESKQLDIDDPALGRKRRASWQIEHGYSRPSIGFFHKKFEGFARQIYFKVLDLLINAIKNRFEEEDYKRYIILENLLWKNVKNKIFADELETVFDNFLEFQQEQFSQQFEQFSTVCPSSSQRSGLSIITWCSKTDEYIWKGTYFSKL